MPKDRKVEATNVASPRSRLEKDKAEMIKRGEASQEQFLNFLINALGDSKDVSISIDGNKRIPIKDLKKKIN